MGGRHAHPVRVTYAFMAHRLVVFNIEHDGAQPSFLIAQHPTHWIFCWSSGWRKALWALYRGGQEIQEAAFFHVGPWDGRVEENGDGLDFGPHIVQIDGLFGLFGTLPPDGKVALASSLPVSSVTDESKDLKYVGCTVTSMPSPTSDHVFF